MRRKPDNAGPRNWDRFDTWADLHQISCHYEEYLLWWQCWTDAQQQQAVAAELRQIDLMKRNTDLVTRNRELEEQVKRLKTVLKEEL